MSAGVTPEHSRGPARAIHCALDIVGRVDEIGLEIRAGIHTAECEVVDGKRAGLAVTIGSPIAAMAGPREVLVSRTVKDLTAGSGFSFDDRGELDLIDELHVSMFPYVAGEGTRLFDGVPRSYPLELISSAASSGGIVELPYRRRR